MEDKMREARLRWLGHVMKRCKILLCGGVRGLLWTDSEEVEVEEKYWEDKDMASCDLWRR